MMKPVDFHTECPKCGADLPSLSSHQYCWRNQNKNCPTWRTYGGEHLHRTCYECRFIFTVLTKDFSKSQEQVDDDWLSKKVDKTIAAIEDEEGMVLLADDIDWEEPVSSERPDIP